MLGSLVSKAVVFGAGVVVGTIVGMKCRRQIDNGLKVVGDRLQVVAETGHACLDGLKRNVGAVLRIDTSPSPFAEPAPGQSPVKSADKAA